MFTAKVASLPISPYLNTDVISPYLNTDVVNIVSFIENDHTLLLQLTGHHLRHLRACAGSD